MKRRILVLFVILVTTCFFGNCQASVNMWKEEIPTYINSRAVVFNAENRETSEIELFWPDYADEYTILSLHGGETIFVYMYAEGALINYMAGGSIENSGISKFEIKLSKVQFDGDNIDKTFKFP